MRILTVSAHYPPNFVSGGTLQPQGIARGLAARGHESHVFAGWLGDRTPLDRWDEVDEHGVAVHWIASTGFEDEMRLSCQCKVEGDVEIEVRPSFNLSGEVFWSKPFPFNK